MYAKQSLRYLRRTHHYPKDVYSHRARFEEAAIIPHAMRAAERSTISLVRAKTRRIRWMFCGLKYREMIQPVREKRRDIRAAIIHPIARHRRPYL